MRPTFQSGLYCLLSIGVVALPAFAQQPDRNPATDAFALIPERPSAFFVDATATHVPLAPSLHATDSVFIDVNKDGHLDAVVSVEYGVNRLHLNDGTGKLIYQPHAFGTVMHDSEHVRAADFDGDGNMDVVFVSESDEVHQLFLGDGKGGFTDVSERLPASSQGNALAVGDVNGDGLPDIVIGSTGEEGLGPTMRLYPARNLLFLNDPKRPGHFIDATATHLPQTDDQTEGLALADIDGDGDLDLLIASPSHPNRLLINDGAGRFTDESERLDLRVPMETREVHVFDANSDALPDALAGPAIEGVVDRSVRAVVRWAVAPAAAAAAAAAQHMDDTGQNASVIDTWRAAIMGQKRLDLRPLIIVQPEQPAHGACTIHEPIGSQIRRWV